MRILIVKLGALGDVLRTTGLLPALLARHPGARICWAASEAALPLLQGLPVEAMTLERAGAQERSFDLVLSMEEDPRAARLARRLCRGELVGVTEEDGRLGYTESSRAYYDMSLLRPESRGGRAAADAAKAANRRGYIDLWCGVLGLTAAAPARPLLALGADELAAGREAAAELLRGGRRPLIGLAPFAAGRWKAKSLSPSASARAARELAGLGGTVAVFSAPEQGAARRAAAAGASRKNVVDAGDARGLRAYAALLAACDAVVCVDTLSAHLAAALELPVAVLVGPTSAAEIDAGARGGVCVPPGGCSCFYAPACGRPSPCLDELPAGFVAERGRRLLELASPRAERT
ncbi:MAG TPA: glycosyltransferase family 9 protein [Elusimicrobiota bacterium]|nr:glycosyltransferase family 9 protein [Elusimicrobiota bacterium]